MAIDLRSYGRLPLLAAAWCFWGTCFYSFLVYQMYGERGRRNRPPPLTLTDLSGNTSFLQRVQVQEKKIHVMLGLIPPEVTPEDEECNALLNETLYSDADNSKPLGK